LCRRNGWGIGLVKHLSLLTLALTCMFVRLGIINSSSHCLAYCMFLDVGNALRMARLLLSQLLYRQPSNYETHSINHYYSDIFLSLSTLFVSQFG